MSAVSSRIRYLNLITPSELLNNDSKLQEILWNFTRFPPERRITLSQSPHFYGHLPSQNTNWSEFDSQATEENWHTRHPQPICVLTNTTGRRVFLELGRTPRAFDNVWSVDEILIFKSQYLRSFFFLLILISFQVYVENSRVKVLSQHPSKTTSIHGFTWSLCSSLGLRRPWTLRILAIPR